MLEAKRAGSEAMIEGESSRPVRRRLEYPSLALQTSSQYDLRDYNMASVSLILTAMSARTANTHALLSRRGFSQLMQYPISLKMSVVILDVSNLPDLTCKVGLE
jgi:hypothetical protein